MTRSPRNSLLSGRDVSSHPGHESSRIGKLVVSTIPIVLMSVIVAAIGMVDNGMAATPVGPEACTTDSENVKRLEAQLEQHVRAVRNLGMPTTAQTAEQWLEI